MKKWAGITANDGGGFITALGVGTRKIHQGSQDFRLADALLEIDHLGLQLGNLRLQFGVARAQGDDIARRGKELLNGLVAHGEPVLG